MNRCTVYGCGKATEEGRELCPACRAFLAFGEAPHPALSWPKWEILPRLDSIIRALQAREGSVIRSAGMRSLEGLAEELRRKR